MTRVGILGIGFFLPPIVRTNGWWTPDVVDRWIRERADLHRSRRPPANLTPGGRRVLAALADQQSDPFLGTESRHIMPDGMTLQDMESEAAETAIARSGVPRENIGLLLTHRTVPDFQLGNPACDLHHRLHLPKECFAMQVEAAAHSFILQLAFAEAMILAGRITHALLVQSCALSRLVDWNGSIAPLFGDAATAAVVGKVPAGRGLLANVTYTDGRFPRTVIASAPGGTWYDTGSSIVQEADRDQLEELMLQTADVCRESILEALSRCGRKPSEIDFLASHQGKPWMRKLVQDEIGGTELRSVELFRETGYIFSAMIPGSLARAEQSGILRPDDLVVLVGGGTGHTYGATVLVWGA